MFFYQLVGDQQYISFKNKQTKTLSHIKITVSKNLAVFMNLFAGCYELVGNSSQSALSVSNCITEQYITLAKLIRTPLDRKHHLSSISCSCCKTDEMTKLKSKEEGCGYSCLDCLMEVLAFDQFSEKALSMSISF